MLSRFAASAAMSAALLLAPPIARADILYPYQLSFTSLGIDVTLTGSITFDHTTGAIVAEDLTLAGEPLLADDHFLTSMITGSSATSLTAVDPGNDTLQVTFSSSLDADAPDPFASLSIVDDARNNSLRAGPGSGTAVPITQPVATPEPATAGVLGVALAALAIRRRKPASAPPPQTAPIF